MSNIKFLYILYKDFKRFFKKHKYSIFLIFVFLLIIFLSCNSVLANDEGEYIVDGEFQPIVPTQDVFVSLSEQYDKCEATFLSYAQFILLRNNDSSSVTAVNTFMNSVAYGNCVYYSYYAPGRIVAFVYRAHNDTTGYKYYMDAPTNGTYAIGEIPYIAINNSRNYLSYYSLDLRSRTMTYNNTDTNTYYVPLYVYNYTSSLTSQFILKNLYHQDNQYDQQFDDIQSSLSDIALSSTDTNNKIGQLKSSMDSKLNNIDSSVEDVEEAIKDTTEAVKDLEDTITDTSVNLENSLPSDTTTDITQQGIDNIFLQLKNSFTSGVASDIVVPIPFTGKSFTIKANLLSSVLSGTQFSWLSSIIEAFWWYIISVFIVSDISKKFNKIKSGDVENLQNDNIKEDML